MKAINADVFNGNLTAALLFKCSLRRLESCLLYDLDGALRKELPYFGSPSYSQKCYEQGNYDNVNS